MTRPFTRDKMCSDPSYIKSIISHSCHIQPVLPTITKITYKWRKSYAMHHVRFWCSHIAFSQRNIDQW